MIVMKKVFGIVMFLILVPTLAFEKTTRSQEEMDAISSIREKGGLVLEVAQNDSSLDVAFHLASRTVEDADLQPLIHLRDVVNLNLRGTGITDGGLAYLKDLKTLRRLHLEKTGITNAGLEHLKDLNQLMYLNLYETAVTDEGLQHLGGLSQLSKLYLWKTKVTESGLDRLRKSLPKLQIIIGAHLTADASESLNKGNKEKDEKKAE